MILTKLTLRYFSQVGENLALFFTSSVGCPALFFTGGMGYPILSV